MCVSETRIKVGAKKMLKWPQQFHGQYSSIQAPRQPYTVKNELLLVILVSSLIIIIVHQHEGLPLAALHFTS